MAALTTIALGTAIVASPVAGPAMSHREQRQAASQQRQASRMEQRRASLENARERRRAIAQSMIQRSQIEASAAGMGGSTTGTQTTTGAIQSQTASALGFQRGQEGAYSSILQAQNRANQRMSRAATYQALGQLPGQLGLPGIGSLFMPLGSRNS